MQAFQPATAANLKVGATLNENALQASPRRVVAKGVQVSRDLINYQRQKQPVGFAVGDRLTTIRGWAGS
jgi:hypothetical protein